MMMMMIAALSCDGNADDDDDYDEVGPITIMIMIMTAVMDELWHAPYVVVWHSCLAYCRVCFWWTPRTSTPS